LAPDQPSSRPPREAIHVQALRLGKRIAIGIAGGVVILVGLVLSVPLVPGPGALVILVGLAILSLEFEKPRVWLAQLKVWGHQLRERYKAARRSRSSDG